VSLSRREKGKRQNPQQARLIPLKKKSVCHHMWEEYARKKKVHWRFWGPPSKNGQRLGITAKTTKGTLTRNKKDPGQSVSRGKELSEKRRGC